MIEQQSSKHSGSEYKLITVIAGDDSRGALRMSALVRRKLNEGGWQAVTRSGRWTTENDALGDICPTGEAVNVDGVLFVYYNQLSLFDCRGRTLSYQVEGGEQLGIDQMAARLIGYLKGETGGQNIKEPASTKGL
jgi:hypothetical protein